MPAGQPSLQQHVIEKLEEYLPEFRDSGKNKRRSIISRLSQETLPEGADGHRHKKVTSHRSATNIVPYDVPEPPDG
jgi:hypothetical protein